MKKQPLLDLQIESLGKTTSTKAQVLEKINNSSIEELQAIVPDIPVTATKGIIVDNAEKLLQGLPNFSDQITEAIIKTIGRPVFFVQNGSPVLKGNDIEKLKELVTRAESSLDLGKTIKAIGRIETDNLPGFFYVGTGWLFEDDLIVTNRHVAQLFIDTFGSTFRFKTFFGNPVQPRIDFLAEHENADQAEFQITECVYISTDEMLDIAVFRVSFRNISGFEPLKIADLDSKEREDVAVVGYPAFDSRSNLESDMIRIFENVFDVKRFAPGKVSQLFADKGIGVHDCTTLGGASGAAVISMDTGHVVGLHFAGLEKQGNFFVNALALKSVLSRIPKTAAVHPISRLPSNVSALLEMVPRNCKTKPYTNLAIPSFKISGRLITYASPDSTYAVTKRFFEAAQDSILIGIYDLSANHMVKQITDALQRNVRVSLMLDIDSEKEQAVFERLKRLGVRCVPAPSCASKRVSYFPSSHEKVIVIDEKWTFIQSGNYSNNSIPANELDGQAGPRFQPGNRDMGIAIESAPMARFFTRILEHDMELELSGPVNEGLDRGVFPQGEILVEAPKRIPDPLFPSSTFNPVGSINVQPVLSPDNYVDVVLKLLPMAKRSIKIEQQYIRVDQPKIKQLLAAIPSGIEVQIIVAPAISNPEKTEHEVSVLRDDYRFDVRLLSKKHFVHCHNKLIIVDDEIVLISSQNWSDFAVAKNREAGVIVYDKDITQYYSRIFNADWTMSEPEGEEIPVREAIVGLESFGQLPGKFVLLDTSDIQEV